MQKCPEWSNRPIRERPLADKLSHFPPSCAKLERAAGAWEVQFALAQRFDAPIRIASAAPQSRR